MWRIVVLLSLAVAAPQAASAADWEFLYETDGIKVHRDRTSSAPHYSAEGLINGNIFDVLAVVADLENRAQWMKDLASTAVVEGDFASTAVLYERYDFPWPAADRDTVTKSIATVDYVKAEVSVHYFNTTHPNHPEASGLVRMPKVDGNIVFRYHSDEQTYTKQEITLDVGGDLPDWLVWWVSRNMPVDTLVGLEKRVKETKGQYQSFVTQHKELAKKARSAP